MDIHRRRALAALIGIVVAALFVGCTTTHLEAQWSKMVLGGSLDR